jgi:hypothetical protein
MTELSLISVFCQILLIGCSQYGIRFKGARSIVLEIASWIDAEKAGTFFGHYAILVFSLVLAVLLATSISVWCLVDHLESRV